MGRILKAFSNKGGIKKAGCILMMAFSILLFTATAWSAIADYVGVYYGTYTGTDDGHWIAIVEGSGDVGFLAWSTTNQIMDSDDGITIDDNGNFSGLTDVGNWLSGTIDGAGNVNGTWDRPGFNGTLTGQRFDPTTQVAQFVGNYNGTFTGDDDGTWTMTVNADAYVSCTISPSSGGNYSFDGGINPDGRFFLIDQINFDVGVFGTVSGGVVNGVWSDSDTGESGTLTNQAGGGGGGGGGDTGGGGGGGCFISTLGR